MKIIPYLVAILVAIGIFRASGGLELLARGIGPVTNLIGMPAEALPVALVRPLSGSGASGSNDRGHETPTGPTPSPATWSVPLTEAPIPPSTSWRYISVL